MAAFFTSSRSILSITETSSSTATAPGFAVSNSAMLMHVSSD